MTARLLISCPDQPGIVAAVSGFLHARDANIVASDQHSTDPERGRFFMRMEFHPEPEPPDRADLAQSFRTEVAEPFAMDWRLSFASERKRVAILVSRGGHCLLDLLWRWRSGELDCDIPLVISNHPDMEADVTSFGVPFEVVPVERGKKRAAESAMLHLLAARCDLIVLARYMQILSGDFLKRADAPAINIHHSFLPAFAGADPYARARERGVKIIGATAHYVTEELDAGPIIEQDVTRVSHRHDVDALTRMGADIERTVLARAVRWHLEDRVLVNGARTVIF
jgi:formyltetrahydrofolate deformylase